MEKRILATAFQDVDIVVKKIRSFSPILTIKTRIDWVRKRGEEQEEEEGNGKRINRLLVNVSRCGQRWRRKKTRNSFVWELLKISMLAGDTGEGRIRVVEIVRMFVLFNLRNFAAEAIKCIVWKICESWLTLLNEHCTYNVYRRAPTSNATAFCSTAGIVGTQSIYKILLQKMPFRRLQQFYSHTWQKLFSSPSLCQTWICRMSLSRCCLAKILVNAKGKCHPYHFNATAFAAKLKIEVKVTPSLWSRSYQLGRKSVKDLAGLENFFKKWQATGFLKMFALRTFFH